MDNISGKNLSTTIIDNGNEIIIHNKPPIFMFITPTTFFIVGVAFLLGAYSSLFKHSSYKLIFPYVVLIKKNIEIMNNVGKLAEILIVFIPLILGPISSMLGIFLFIVMLIPKKLILNNLANSYTYMSGGKKKNGFISEFSGIRIKKIICKNNIFEYDIHLLINNRKKYEIGYFGTDYELTKKVAKNIGERLKIKICEN